MGTWGGDGRREKAEEEERGVRCAPWAVGLNPVATGLGIRPGSAVWLEVPGSSVSEESWASVHACTCELLCAHERECVCISGSWTYACTSRSMEEPV